jgi:hypothetical protein
MPLLPDEDTKVLLMETLNDEALSDIKVGEVSACIRVTVREGTVHALIFM